MDHKNQAKNQRILVREILVKDFVPPPVVKQKKWNQIPKCLVTVNFIDLRLIESFWN